MLSALAEVKKEVENICRYDNALEAQLAVITDALYQLEEAAAELRDYTENLDFNPEKTRSIARAPRYYPQNEEKIWRYSRLK